MFINSDWKLGVTPKIVMNWIIITIGTPPITKLDPGVTLPPFADNGWFLRLNAIYFCCFPASHVWFQKDKSAKSIKTHELHKSTAIPFYKSIKIHYIKIKKKTFKSMKNKKKHGSVSKPCTPSVHIKIAGIYGCSFPKNGMYRYWSIPT